MGINQVASLIIKGIVTDATSGNPLTNIQVFIEELGQGTVTDKQGLYTLTVAPGSYQILFSGLNYQKKLVQLSIMEDTELNIRLTEKTTMLDEVIVNRTGTDDNIVVNIPGAHSLGVKQLNEIPAFMGEANIMQGLLTLPGVLSLGEGASGVNIRGGATDQNLFLFDNAPIFNTTHLFGFYSSLNHTVINEVTLYKGYVPGNFGGRASSVININSRDGDEEKFRLQGGIGMIGSQLAADIPLIKDHSSLVIAGRTAYPDWITSRVNDLTVKQSSARFHDVNARWHYRNADTDKFTISGYLSNDDFRFGTDTLYQWSTKNLSANWLHKFSKNLSTSISAVSANYYSTVSGLQPVRQFVLNSAINYLSGIAELYFTPTDNYSAEGGFSFNQYLFSPGELKVNHTLSTVIPKAVEKETSFEISFYLSNEVVLNNVVTVALGVRYANFRNLGRGTVMLYDGSQTKSDNSITDTLVFTDNELIKAYSGFEPRSSVTIKLSSSSSVKASYTRLNQYIHIISNTTTVSPIDYWYPSNYYIPPTKVDQFSIGYFRNFLHNTLETSVEVYYKSFLNSLDYKDGAQIILRNNLEQELIIGNGRAYGIELLIKKTSGFLSGWISYTYSKSEQQSNGKFPEEVINNGRYYPTNYDKPHALSVVGNFKLNEIVSFNLNFSLSSGRPVTAPVSKYIVQSIRVADFSARNEFRVPAYHRLDFSVTFKSKHRKKFSDSWTFSVYNIYGRRNAYSIFFKKQPNQPPGAYRFAVIGTIFPSISYNFKF